MLTKTNENFNEKQNIIYICSKEKDIILVTYL
jgi:hypothetical protein